MWRHIPKIVVLSAIGLLVVTYYFTRGTGNEARVPGQAPNVVYINQGLKTAPPTGDVLLCPPATPKTC